MKELYEYENQIILGDCLPILKSLPDKCIDLLLTDPPSMPWRTATRMVYWPEDGLEVDWTGRRVWCNPPYGRDAMPFLGRMAVHDGGGISLVFARTDNSAWQDCIFPYAYGILFLRGRLRFCYPDGTPGDTAPAPSALVAYSEMDSVRLRNSGLAGTFLNVKAIAK